VRELSNRKIEAEEEVAEVAGQSSGRGGVVQQLSYFINAFINCF